MKPLYRTALTGALCLLLTACGSSADLRPDFFQKNEAPKIFACRTNDMFFMDGQRYLLDRSPLAAFDGYEKIYKAPGTIIAMRPFDVVRAEKDYMAFWAVCDGSLYLFDADYDRKRWNEQIQWGETPRKKEDLLATVERTTGRKFRKNRKIAGCVPDGFSATADKAIPARWVTGTLYAKRPFMTDPNTWPKADSAKAWIQAPFLELTFEKGKLVATEIRTTPPITFPEPQAKPDALSDTRRDE